MSSKFRKLFKSSKSKGVENLETLVTQSGRLPTGRPATSPIASKTPTLDAASLPPELSQPQNLRVVTFGQEVTPEVPFIHATQARVPSSFLPLPSNGTYDAQVAPSNPDAGTASTVPEAANSPSNCAAQLRIPPSVAPIIDRHAEADPGHEECQSVTKPTKQQDQEWQTPELSTSQRLWNTAYNNLEKNDNTAKLVNSYVDILTTGLESIRASNTSASEVNDISAELKDPIKRQTYMRNLVEDGQKKIATTSTIAEGVDNVIEYIDKAKNMISVAIGNIPQAALPWAGVCLGLQVR